MCDRPPSAVTSSRKPVVSMGVAGEDEIARFDPRMAGMAACEHRCLGRFAVVEMPVPPAASCCVFLRVLHHELNPVLWSPGHEGLGTPEEFVVFLGRVEAPGKSRDDRALRERKL